MIITVRPEQQGDIDEIYALNKLAFGQDNEARLVDLLRTGPGYVPGLSLIATAENAVVGHILFSKIFVVSGDARHETLALAPMSVHPNYQKQGVGARLITAGLETARDMGFGSVVVLGHEHYYPKFGFVPASRWGIRAPIDVPDNVFMAIELMPGSLKNVSGIVEYPVEFSAI
nr:Acetyltransferase (GNAT) domain protein [uncultured bacterium]